MATKGEGGTKRKGGDDNKGQENEDIDCNRAIAPCLERIKDLGAEDDRSGSIDTWGTRLANKGDGLHFRDGECLERRTNKRREPKPGESRRHSVKAWESTHEKKSWEDKGHRQNVGSWCVFCHRPEKEAQPRSDESQGNVDGKKDKDRSRLIVPKSCESIHGTREDEAGDQLERNICCKLGGSVDPCRVQRFGTLASEKRFLWDKG